MEKVNWIKRQFDKFRTSATLAIYWFAYLGIFLQLPLKNKLPGNTDTLLSIALSNLLLEKLHLLASGQSSLTVLFPALSPLPYGENCFGHGLIFIFFKLLSHNDIWAYYFYLSAIFALGSLAISKLVSLYVRDFRITFLAGFVFSLSGFTLANIDDPIIVFVFFPVLAMYYLELGIRQKSKRTLLWALVLSGSQIWFGFYDFLFQAIVLGIFSAFYLKEIRNLLNCKELAFGVLAYILPALPLLLVYLNNHFNADIFSPYNNKLTIINSSLNWKSFLTVPQNGLLYSRAHGNGGGEGIGSWMAIRKTCFPGILLPIFAILGMATSLRKNIYLFLLFTVFFVLSFGVNVPHFDFLLALPLGEYFRVAARFYLFALIPLVVFFSIGLNHIIERLKSRPLTLSLALIVCVGLCFIAENMSFPLVAYDYGSLLSPPIEYTKFFSKFSARQIVLDLPSTCFYSTNVHEQDSVWFYNREILYMNWQTQHKQIIFGGVNSYVPRTRAELDLDFQQLPQHQSLAKLKGLGLNYIVYHKRLILNPAEDSLSRLRASHELAIEFESAEVAVFKLI